MASSLANCHKTPRKMDQKSYRVEPRTYHLDKNSNEIKKTNQERREDDLNKFVKKETEAIQRNEPKNDNALLVVSKIPTNGQRKTDNTLNMLSMTEEPNIAQHHDNTTTTRRLLIYARYVYAVHQDKQFYGSLSLYAETLLELFLWTLHSSRHIVVSQFLSGLIEPIAHITRPGFRWFSTVSWHRHSRTGPDVWLLLGTTSASFVIVIEW